MIDISNFERIDNMLVYTSMNQYVITKEDCGFSVSVTSLDEDGEIYENGNYAASSLSVAIATIEALENGEEV